MSRIHTVNRRRKYKRSDSLNVMMGMSVAAVTLGVATFMHQVDVKASGFGETPSGEQIVNEAESYSDTVKTSLSQSDALLTQMSAEKEAPKEEVQAEAKVEETATQAQSSAVEIVNHVVTSADTLNGLAQRYNTTVTNIQARNSIANANLIYDGETLEIAQNDTTEKDVSNLVAQEVVQEEEVVQEASQPQEVQAVAPEEVETEVNEKPQGTVLTMESTAYSCNEGSIGGGYFTATGQDLRENPMAVAVDPSVIPLGTRLYVEGYGYATAVDTGGAIQGRI